MSALRSVDKEDFVQHTAAISHGSSGGALVDSNGAPLGLNSWQVADAQNLNFAISAKHLTEALTVARQSTTVLSFPAAHRTSLAKGEVGIRDKKSIPTLAEFFEHRIEPWAKRRTSWIWYRAGMRSLIRYRPLAQPAAK